MPVIEIAEDNIAANTSELNVIEGKRASQISMGVRAAAVSLLAVASAVGLTHSFYIDDRNPVQTSVVPVSATPNQLIDPDNIIITGVMGGRGEFIRLYVSEVAGAATNDYRARVVVRELGRA